MTEPKQIFTTEICGKNLFQNKGDGFKILPGMKIYPNTFNGITRDFDGNEIPCGSYYDCDSNSWVKP